VEGSIFRGGRMVDQPQYQAVDTRFTAYSEA